MEIDLTSLLGNFILAATVYALLSKQLEYMQKRVETLENELKRTREECDRKVDAATDAHIQDLRDWSGIDPRFETWKRRTTATVIEDDTNIRRNFTPEQQNLLRAAQEDEMRKRGNITGFGTD